MARSQRMKVLCVFGTRPEAIKMAPVVTRLLAERRHFLPRVIITAQHRHMLDQMLRFFRLPIHRDLNLMTEDQSLGQIAWQGLRRLSQVFRTERADLVLVQGDTTTAFAAALAAFYQQIPVGHIEAGLRSYNKGHPYPEEANRVMIDTLATLHFAPTPQAREHLLAERIPVAGIFVTGNTVIDALRWAASRTYPWEDPRLAQLFNANGSIPRASRLILVTAHRRESFGKPLERICRGLRRVVTTYEDVSLIYPVHPNPNVERVVRRYLTGVARVHLIPPLSYSDLVQVLQRSYLVLTDSGGLQEEAPALGKPVLVLREVTERPEGLRAGTAQLVGVKEADIVRALERLLTEPPSYRRMARAVNPYGDGLAAERTVQALRFHFRLRSSRPADWKPGQPTPHPPSRVPSSV